jgi:hypothetical protein
MNRSSTKRNVEHQQPESNPNLKQHVHGSKSALNQRDDTDVSEGNESSMYQLGVLERKLVRKVDLRLCTIAGILCSLNLLDSGIISSASVTSIFDDLGLGVGNRYVSFQ